MVLYQSLSALFSVPNHSASQALQVHQVAPQGKALLRELASVSPSAAGDIPMCMYTFIEAHDWAGKTVIPFCTSEGSGAGSTDRTLKSALKGAEVKRVMGMRETTAQNNPSEFEQTVDRWLKTLGLEF